MSEGLNNTAATWAVAPLGDVLEILDARRIPINSEEREKRPGKVPYYGATGQVGWIDDYIFDEEVILLGEDGAPFLDPVKPKAYLIDGKSWVNNHAHVLKAVRGLSNRFVMYQLNQIDYRGFVSGTTRLKLPQAPMRQISLRIAPEREQNQIVAEIEKQFTRLDAAVVALERVRANLKRYRAAILKAACEGRLVPTEAELARRERRSYEPSSDLLERILADRRLHWKANQGKNVSPRPPDSLALPPLPEGWAWASFDQLLTYLRNGISQKPDAESGQPILRISAVRPMKVDLEDVRFLRPEASHSEYVIEDGDLLFTRYNGNPALTGVCGVVRQPEVTVVHPDKLIRAKVARQLVDPRFLEIVLNAGESRRFLESRVRTTAGQSGISGSDLRSLPVPLAPFAEQQRIVGEADRRLSVIDALRDEVEADLKRAERLRHAILLQAFQGRLVSQNPNDEPASNLLERIRAEKEIVAKTAVPKGRRKKEALHVS